MDGQIFNPGFELYLGTTKPIFKYKHAVSTLGNLNTLICIIRNSYSDQYSRTSTIIQQYDILNNFLNPCPYLTYRLSSTYSDPYFLCAIKVDSGNSNTLIRILRNTYSDQYTLTNTTIEYSD